jgi:hypothetical protein
MRPLKVALGVGALILLSAGCGSSGDGWQVITRGQTISGTDPGYVSGTVGRPSEVEAKVEARPDVTSTTHYTITCGEDSWNRRGPRVETPQAVRVILPPGNPGPCIVKFGATKSAPAEMTVTILMRQPVAK